MTRTAARKSTARRVVYDAPNGPCVIEPNGQLKNVSSPRYDAAKLALSQAWEHRPPVCTWERALYEKTTLPAVRAEVRAAWLETADQWGIQPDPF